MKLLQISGQEWRDLKSSITAGTIPAGTFMVFGPSEEITAQTQTMLEGIFQLRYHIRYFLCSGSGIFRLPCFLPFANNEVTPEPLSAIRLLTGEAFAREAFVKRVMNEAVEGLEQIAIRECQLPRLILVEYLTPPASVDLSFTVSLLRSAIPQHIPIVMLAHQASANDSLSWHHCDAVERTLLTLYLCAGRMHQADWQKIRDQLPEKSCCDHVISSRRIEAGRWTSYANRQIAEKAEKVFQSMEAARKHEIARNVLHVLPHATGYPLLAIASETDDLATMLSIYSQAAVNTALSEPEALIKYFDQVTAQKADDAMVMSQAYVSYLSSQLLLSGELSLQTYKKLQKTALPDNIGKETEGFFWNTLGQQFVKMKQPETWEYAADCFQLSRKCFQYPGLEDHPGIQMGLALIANGEALVAYKRQQGEKARQLEEFALEKSKGLVFAPNFQVHVKINLGDVFLRLLDDREAALAQYGEALLEVFQICKKFGLRAVPKRLATLRRQAALKLGNTLVQAERYDEAIDFLEHFLSYAKKEACGSGEEKSIAAFKIRLVLAEAYLETEQQRKAAASYWHILRHPQWLEPVALKEVAEKLSGCRPAIHKRLRRYIERIVSEREVIIADTLKVQYLLQDYSKSCSTTQPHDAPSH